MKFAPVAAAAALAFATVPAASMAQDAQVVAGAVIYGPEGNEVGTIKQIDGDTVLLDTGTYVAPIPMSAIGTGEQLKIGATKARLDQMMEAQIAQQKQARDAALVEGVAVADVEGTAIGTVEAVEGDKIKVETAEGSINMPREMFVASETGVIAAITADEVFAAIANASAETETETEAAS